MGPVDVHTLLSPHRLGPSCSSLRCHAHLGNAFFRSSRRLFSQKGSFLAGRSLRSGAENGTCRLSMKQRAFHFEVGGDGEGDDERAFQDFSNLEKQTKVVDEQRRRRYFESASDFKKRMTSQRFASARRARQDSWIQAYSEVFEEEASPFQDLFEGPGADSLFASNEFVDGRLTSFDEGDQFAGRQLYGQGGAQVSQAQKVAPSEHSNLNEGLQKPLSSRARSEDEAVPQQSPGASGRAGQVNTIQQRRPTGPVKRAEQANQQAQVSDASQIETSNTTEGNIGAQKNATSKVPAEVNETLFTNQFDTPAPKVVPASKDTRKPKKPVKGFAGGRGSKPPAGSQGPGKAKGAKEPELASR